MNAETTTDKTCSNCNAQNEWNARYCQVCEQPLAGWNPDHVSRLPYERTFPQPDVNLLYLQLPDTADVIAFDIQQVSKLRVGRADISTSTLPDVDLAPYHGRLRGVSRNHALILREEGSVHAARYL